MAEVVELRAGQSVPDNTDHLLVQLVPGGRYQVSGDVEGGGEATFLDSGPYDNETQAIAAAQTAAFNSAVPVIYVRKDG